MAITFGTVTTATPTFSWDGSAFTATQSYTLAAGSTQIAVVVHGTQGGTISAVNWGGVALSSREDQPDGNLGRVRYYDLDAPSSGTANVTISCNVDLTGAGVTIFGISGVATGTPRRTAGGANAFSATAAVTVTTVSGDTVVGFASTTNSGTADGSLTVLNSNFLAAGEYGSSAYIVASGTSTTVQWTQTSENWCAVAIPYIPAASGPAPSEGSVTFTGNSSPLNLKITPAVARVRDAFLPWRRMPSFA